MDIIDKINYASESNNYTKTLKFINEYMNENGFLDGELLNIYVKCLIGLNRYSDALNVINAIRGKYPDYYKTVELARRYIECGKYDVLDELSKDISPNEVYDIGAYLLSHKEYDMAKTYLTRYMDMIKLDPDYHNDTIKQMAMDYLEILNSENVDTTQLPIVYKKFIEDGKVLVPGNIIYAKKARNFENKVIESNTPYMVWKKMEGCCYAFALNRNTQKSSRFTILAKNYLGQVVDRRVKDTPVIVKDKYIQRVVGKLTDEDLENAFKEIYLTLCYTGNKLGKVYMDEYLKKLNIKYGDIVKIKDYDTGQKSWYLVVNIDKENKKYSLIRITSPNNNEVKMYTGNILIFPLDTYIIEKKTLSKEEINKILSNTPVIQPKKLEKKYNY